MDYESTRSGVEIQMEEAKLKAHEDAAAYNLSGDVPDPNWAQPAESGDLAGVGLDEAQGLWINDGNQSGNDTNAEFDHDLPTLLKNGPKDLPTIPEDESVVITTSEIENRIAARDGPPDDPDKEIVYTISLPSDDVVESTDPEKELIALEDIAEILNLSLNDLRTGIDIGLYNLKNLKKATRHLRFAR